MQTHAKNDKTLVNCCSVVDCDYNDRGICQASAVTIGDKKKPNCATFKKSRISPKKKALGWVRVCNQVLCENNMNNVCQSKEIRVGIFKGKATCRVYNPHLE